jgi:hypothetical protein
MNKVENICKCKCVNGGNPITFENMKTKTELFYLISIYTFTFIYFFTLK